MERRGSIATSLPMAGSNKGIIEVVHEAETVVPSDSTACPSPLPPPSSTCVYSVVSIDQKEDGRYLQVA